MAGYSGGFIHVDVRDSEATAASLTPASKATITRIMKSAMSLPLSYIIPEEGIYNEGDEGTSFYYSQNAFLEITETTSILGDEKDIVVEYGNSKISRKDETYSTIKTDTNTYYLYKLVNGDYVRNKMHTDSYVPPYVYNEYSYVANACAISDLKSKVEEGIEIEIKRINELVKVSSDDARMYSILSIFFVTLLLLL